MTTVQKTQRFLARRLEIDEGEITPERTLESLGIDSLAALELLFDVEDEFAIRLSHGDEKITTVGDLLVVVERERARRCAAAAMATGASS